MKKTLWACLSFLSALCAANAQATPVYSGLSITGYSQGLMQISNQTPLQKFKATAIYRDSATGAITQQDVTNLAAWSSSNTAAAYFTSAGQIATGSVAANTAVTLTASYLEGGKAYKATKAYTIVATVTPITGRHAGYFTAYTGPKVCADCHSKQATDIANSQHGQAFNKADGFNNYCKYVGASIKLNWLSIMTSITGVVLDQGCGRCHISMGFTPVSPATQAYKENQDCLLCHAPGYKRMLQLQADGSYAFVPNTGAMTVSLLQAASDITPDTTSGKPIARDACLNCHEKSGGGNGYKLDLSPDNRAPVRDNDVHMSAGITCVNCHKSSVSPYNHEFIGSGHMPSLQNHQTCQNATCHVTIAHANSVNTSHAKVLDCALCHIKQFARVAAYPTEIVRDWSQSGVQLANGLYEPFGTKANNLTPVAKFWDGTNQVVGANQTVTYDADGTIIVSKPNGTRAMAGTKLVPWKKHLSYDPVDPVRDVLLPLKMGLFFRDNNLPGAINGALTALGWQNNGYAFKWSKSYQRLAHNVQPKVSARVCTDCHYNSTDTLLTEVKSEYTPKSPTSTLCSSCHSLKSISSFGSTQYTAFVGLHNYHVTSKGINCSSCHTFSKR